MPIVPVKKLPPAPIPVSAQLWSVKDLAAKDFAGTVAALAKMGYRGVETAGYGNLDAAGAAAAIKAAKIVCSGMHIGIEALRANLTQVVTEARQLGTRNIICPFMPRELFTSPSSIVAIGRELGALGERLSGFGLRFHYHNHSHEMAKVGAQTAFEELLDAAAPAHLGAQLDVFWAHSARIDPAKLLRRLGARCRLVHLKDKNELGSGAVNFAAVFAALDAVGAAEWQIVEVEDHKGDPLESMRISLDRLKGWGRLSRGLRPGDFKVVRPATAHATLVIKRKSE
jgi:sugar phosphate isomerase/epimerase